MFKKYKKLTIIFISILLIGTSSFCSTTNSLNGVQKPMIRNQEHSYKEADYVCKYCTGQIEYRLSDGTRVDCLTDEYAIEFDWAKKWAESIGQSLYYAKMTNRKPGVVLIIKDEKDYFYLERFKKVADKYGIKYWIIKALNNI